MDFDIYARLVGKSIEAFIMGLEIYNKPTIRYRVEGFSFFICNAWELMLKAQLINIGENIYYDDNNDRTLSLSDCLKKVYTNKHTRIRQNLEKIIDLRNVSTHYITEDYEIKYAPLFQACVINYVEELNRFHDKDITKSIPQNFLTIHATIEPLSNSEIKLKYPARIAEKLIQKSNEIDILSREYDSDKFAINIKQNLYITKKKNEANFTVKIDKESTNLVEKIRELKDPSNTHKYSFKTIITVMNDKIKKENLNIGYDKGFNNYVLTMFIDFYDIKDQEKYSYKHTIGKREEYTYSQLLIDFLLRCIKESRGNFVESLKDGLDNKKR